MKKVGLLVAALLALLPMGSAWAQAYLNVKDAPYSAAGDGATDDTEALQEAIDAAGASAATRIVYLPPGAYRITGTLNVSGIAKRNVSITGAGPYSYGAYTAASRIVWDGASDGTMVNISGAGSGVTMADLLLDGDLNADGNNKAGTLINVEYAGGIATANVSLGRVQLRNAATGFYCSGAPDLCNSDMTFIDVGFANMTRGFHTAGGQNVNYVFVRPAFNNIDYAMYFEKGGVVACENLGGACVGTAIKIIGTQAGNGTFVFNTTKVETQLWKGKRTVILDCDATAEGCVTFNALNVTMQAANDDQETPLFKVAGKMHVLVQNSILYGNQIATLTGAAGQDPALLIFDTCKFGWGPDPRATIVRSGNAGYELRNCVYGNGKIPATADFAGVLATPAPPTNVRADTLTSSSAILRWDDAADETGYRVDKCPWVDANQDGKNDSWSWTTVSDAIAANATSCTVGGLDANTKYFLRVRAKKGTAYALGPYISITTLP